ncbi:MAG: carbon-nitrogen hydrolase family protein [Candidatus Latescibacteria bacterium]|nr:carbon-nitrogen hydrolase family protein [Candidatus Latescibacterota bacterium]
MRIALAQFTAESTRQDSVEKAFGMMEQAAQDGADVICFPEMAFDVFFPQFRADRQYFALAEPIPGPLVEQFQAKARALGLVTVINLFERAAPGEYYDCSPVIDADGRLLGKSRMMHIAELPRYNEKYYYWEGNTGYPVSLTRAGRIGIAICYDRHYPEHVRALALQGAQVMLVPTATSLPELGAIWELEMQAAAVANQMFIGVANRIGREGDLTFFGSSFAVNPKGEVIGRASNDREEILCVDCDLRLIEEMRQRLPFLRDRRPETYGMLCEGKSLSR